MDYIPRPDGVAAAARPTLMDMVRRRIRLKHDSIRAERAYVGWVRHFVLASGRGQPRALGQAEIEPFLRRLASEGNEGAGIQNRALSAPLFLYREVLEMDVPGSRAWSVPSARRIPVVLSIEEVEQPPRAAPFLRHQLLEAGSDLRTVQELLGDKDLAITQICTHVLGRGASAVRSRLDRLEAPLPPVVAPG